MRLYVIDFLGEGGITNYNYQLCDALQDSGIDVTLITSDRFEFHNLDYTFRVKEVFQLWALFDNNVKSTTQSSIQIYIGQLYRSFRRLWRLARGYIEWCRMTRMLLQDKPDIVQFGTVLAYPFAPLFLWYLKQRGIHLTQICHEFEERSGKGNLLIKLSSRLNARSYPLFDAIIFHAEYGRTKFVQRYPVDESETYVLPMGNESSFARLADNTLDYRRKYGIGHDEYVILFFGRVTPDKGILDLIEAFSILLQQVDIPIRLVVAGSPIKLFGLQVVEKVKEVNVENQTILDLGYIPNECLKPLMDIASVAVFPYHTSSQSLSLQMAYICGKPVIATRVGGLPEAVEPDESGLLVDPHSPDQIADAINYLICNPVHAAQMGAHAKHLSETKHSWHTIAAEVSKIYQKTINS